MDNIKAKPCPFCGNENHIVYNHSVIHGRTRKRKISVACANCKAQAGKVTVKEVKNINDVNSISDEVLEIAYNKWNRRYKDIEKILNNM